MIITNSQHEILNDTVNYRKLENATGRERLERLGHQLKMPIKKETKDGTSVAVGATGSKVARLVAIEAVARSSSPAAAAARSAFLARLGAQGKYS